MMISNFPSRNRVARKATSSPFQSFWIGLLFNCLFLLSIPKSAQAALSFSTPEELQLAVDMFLSQDPQNLTLLDSTYGPIETWDVSQITHFDNLFNARTRNPLAATVNVDLSRWDVGNAQYMHDMFLDAAMIDFDVSQWDTSNVIHFNGMWEGALLFQGRGLERWDVSQGKLFMSMFAQTQSLLPSLDLRNWNLRDAERLSNMFRDSNFGSDCGIMTRNEPSSSYKEVTYNLCDWMNIIPLNAQMDGMFSGTDCPDPNDPDLLLVAQTDAAVSFCVPCTGKPSQPVPTSSAGRPNVLLIMADQMRFDMIRSVQEELRHYDGHFKIETPNLDRLKQQGVYFRNAYCQCAVCAPARTTIRTGCTIERSGIQHNDLVSEYENGPLFQERVENLEGIDHVLVDKLGYVSEYYGKWHLPEVLAMSREYNKPVVQFNDYDYESNSFYYKDDATEKKLERHLQYFENLGRISKDLTEEGMQIDSYTEYPYMPIKLDSRWNMPTGTSLYGDQFQGEEIGQANILGRYKLSANYTPTYFEGSVAVKALERLQEQRRVDGKAWFLTASFHSPHPPMVPAWKYLSKYWSVRSELFVPPSLNDDLENSAYTTITEQLPRYGDPTNIQEWTALYYALIEEVDDYVGQLLDAVARDTMSNNTLVIFTSDHGEMLGAHRKREKNNFYEESARVPLLMSFPGIIRQNSVVEESVTHLDIFSTILDYVGASDLDGSDGTSLRPMIEVKSDMLNAVYDQDVAIGEWDFRKPLLSDTNILERTIDDRPSYMVRKGSYKLMMQKLASSNQMDMMFNLKTDPHEMNNLLGKYAMIADDAVVSKAEHLRCLLLDWMTRLDEGVNGTRYYSDPASNYGEGQGDIFEVRERQQWKQIGLWTSGNANDPLQFGQISLSGSAFVRHEWLYLGTRLDEDFVISSVRFTGTDALFFSVDELNVVGRIVRKNSCESIRVTFQANVWVEKSSLDATMELSLTDAFGVTRTISIPLVLSNTHFVKRRASETAAAVSPSGCRLGSPSQDVPMTYSASVPQLPFWTNAVWFGMTIMLLSFVG